jgi:hypothetical protein
MHQKLLDVACWFLAVVSQVLQVSISWMATFLVSYSWSLSVFHHGLPILFSSYGLLRRAHNELQVIWKEECLVWSTYSADICMKGLSESTRAEIRTGHLPNTGLLCKCHNSLPALTGTIIFLSSPPTLNSGVLLCSCCQGAVCTSAWCGSGFLLFSGSLKTCRFRPAHFNSQCIYCAVIEELLVFIQQRRKQFQNGF